MAEIRTNVRVERILGDSKRASAVRPTSGEEIPAVQLVVSNVDPAQLVINLLGVEMAGRGIIDKMKQYEWGDSVFVLFVALDAPINYKAGPVARQSGMSILRNHHWISLRASIYNVAVVHCLRRL